MSNCQARDEYDARAIELRDVADDLADLATAVQDQVDARTAAKRLPF